MNPSTNPRDGLTDEEILARLQSGETDLFGALVRRYERELYGYLRRYVGDDELAADVFQNTFVQVFLKIDRYERGRPARPWLYTIAMNQAIDALRKRARRPDSRADPLLPGEESLEPSNRPLFEILASAEPGPLERAEESEQRRLVREAVDRLPDNMKQVVILAYFQGLQYQDVAEVLRIPLGTVKSRLHAAIAKLTEIWNETNPGE